MVYGVWQMYLPTGNCVSPKMFLRQIACHRGWSSLPDLLPRLPQKLPNLVPNPLNVQPRWQLSLQPNLQLESPFLWPLLSMCSSSRWRQKKWAHRACCSVDLNMHPYNQCPRIFVVHMPSCLHLLFDVAHPLSSNRGRAASLGAHSLGGAREPSHAATTYWTRGAEGDSLF